MTEEQVKKEQLQHISEYCDECGTLFKYLFRKEQLQHKGGGLYSGVFLHRSKENDEIHALLVYFDKNLANRGGEDSKVIKTQSIPLEKLTQEGYTTEFQDSMQLGTVSPIMDEEVSKLVCTIFYEWLIDEFTYQFVNILRYSKESALPALTKILDDLKPQSEIYKNLRLVYDKSNDKIAFDIKKNILHEINYNDLKTAYQVLFEHIKTHFKEKSAKDTLQISRNLGQLISQWRDIVSLGLPEDVIHMLDA